MLRELSPDLWVAERALRFFGIEIGTRMTVARLADGSLFVHSPSALDSETRHDLDALGAVRFVVAPNRFHHLFVGDYFGAYPEARIYAAPGLAEKRRDLAFHGVLGDDAEPAWADQIDQLVFRAMALFNEVVFCHRRSRTLILTDLAFNVQEAPSLVARFLFRLTGAYRRFGADRIGKCLIRDRQAGRAALDRILAWDFDRVIVAHGDVLKTGGHETLRTSFAWL